MRPARLTAGLLIAACATTPKPVPSDREVLTRALDAFMGMVPQSGAPTLWLTNEDDMECDRSDGANHAPRLSHALDALAWEVFTNRLVASRWATPLEAHRHNYARDLKPQTHKTIVLEPDTSTVVEDLCLLDEAKKRYVEKVLVYEVLGTSRGAVLVRSTSGAWTDTGTRSCGDYSLALLCFEQERLQQRQTAQKATASPAASAPRAHHQRQEHRATQQRGDDADRRL